MIHRSFQDWLLPDRQPNWLRGATILLFFAAIAVTALRINKTLHVPPALPEFTQGLTDFHNSVYFPALGMSEGYNPYSQQYIDHYPTHRLPPYSPAMFWLNYPFSLMPLPVANVVYFVWSCALVIAVAASALAVCRLPRSMVNVLGLATLIMISRPGHVNLLLGQITLLIVLGAIWGMELARRRPYLGACLLALTTLKPTFAVPIFWLMFCRRDYRTVFAATLIGGVAALVGLAPIVTTHGWNSLLQSLGESQAKLEADPTVATQTTWTRIDMGAMFGKIAGKEPTRLVVAAIAAVCLLAAGWALHRLSNSPADEGADSLSALMIASTTLASIYHGAYDGLLLILPWIAVSAGQLRCQLPACLRVPVWVLLTIPAINYFSTREVITRLGIEEPLLTPLTMINSVCVAALMIVSTGAALRMESTVRVPGGRAATSSTAA